MNEPPFTYVRGDRVRCVRADDTFGLEAGASYTIEGHHSWVGNTQLVYIEGRPDVVPLNGDRFELVEPVEITSARRHEFRRMAKRDLAVLETLEIAGIDPVQAKPEGEPKADPRMSRDDMVNLPKHYARYAIEPIRFICENALDFMRGNAVKYILRCDAKNGREDLDKARRYLDMFEKFHFDQDPEWWRVGA